MVWPAAFPAAGARTADAGPAPLAAATAGRLQQRSLRRPGGGRRRRGAGAANSPAQPARFSSQPPADGLLTLADTGRAAQQTLAGENTFAARH